MKEYEDYMKAYDASEEVKAKAADEEFMLRKQE
jgi:hypothetical protein